MRIHSLNALHKTKSQFTKRMDVLPQDLVKSRSCEIRRMRLTRHTQFVGAPTLSRFYTFYKAPPASNLAPLDNHEPRILQSLALWICIWIVWNIWTYKSVSVGFLVRIEAPVLPTNILILMISPHVWELNSRNAHCVIMMQGKITGFLSPPTACSRNQSLGTPPPGQSRPKTTPDLPKRVSKKSKKLKKEQRKRQRKRAKLHRACKRDNPDVEPCTPERNDVTPMPSPNEQSTLGMHEWDVHCETYTSMLIGDKSLTDMLASVGEPRSDGEHPSRGESYQDAILRLEARVLAANIELQGVSDECNALQQQIELLMTEIDKFQKVDKMQKLEIKKLTNDNDKLKRDISKYNGMRRFTSSDTQSPVVNECIDSRADCSNCKTLRSKLIRVTDTLVTALDEHASGDFTVVTHRKRGQTVTAPSNSCVQKSHQPNTDTRTPNKTAPPSFASVMTRQVSTPTPMAPRTLSQQPSERSLPRLIPVIQIGAAARHATQGGTTALSERSPAAEPTERNNPSEKSSGTSLISGLGPMLHRQGIPATSYMYRGADIPTIQGRISSILPPGATPKRVILQVAGNDVTKHFADKVTARYDALISGIKMRSPQVEIILSKVPPCKGTPRTMSSINEINRRIDTFASKIQNVSSIDVCPSALHHFKKDCTHFNAAGVKSYANGMANVLRNFHRQHQTPNL